MRALDVRVRLISFAAAAGALVAVSCASAPAWAEEAAPSRVPVASEALGSVTSPSPAAAGRAAEARRLGHVGGKDAVARLTQMLKSDPDESVRVAAAWAIGKIGHRGHAEVLRDAVQSDSSPQVRDAAMRASLQVSERPGPPPPANPPPAATAVAAKANAPVDRGPSPGTAAGLALGTTFGGMVRWSRRAP